MKKPLTTNSKPENSEPVKLKTFLRLVMSFLLKKYNSAVITINIYLLLPPTSSKVQSYYSLFSHPVPTLTFWYETDFYY